MTLSPCLQQRSITDLLSVPNDENRRDFTRHIPPRGTFIVLVERRVIIQPHHLTFSSSCSCYFSSSGSPLPAFFPSFPSLVFCLFFQQKKIVPMFSLFLCFLVSFFLFFLYFSYFSDHFESSTPFPKTYASCGVTPRAPPRAATIVAAAAATRNRRARLTFRRARPFRGPPRCRLR